MLFIAFLSQADWCVAEHRSVQSSLFLQQATVQQMLRWSLVTFRSRVLSKIDLPDQKRRTAATVGAGMGSGLLLLGKMEPSAAWVGFRMSKSTQIRLI